MPAKPAPIKKAAKKAAPKEEKPKQEKPAEPAPAPVPEPEPEPAPAEAPPAVEAPAEAAVAETAPPAEAPAPEGPAEEAAPSTDAPAEAAPAEAAPVEEPPKAPTPPPPAVPTSAPQNLSVEDVNDTSVTLKWRSPENIGSGLDGYTVEYCKEGSSEWVVANKELITSNRIVISGLTTGDLLNIRVVAVNAGGRSEPVSLAQPVTVREVVDRPKIRLPRALRSRYVKHVGEQINVVIPFVGKPKPVISWTKDGQPLDTKKVNIRNSDKDSILFIRKSEREDSGNYEMTVKVDSFEDKASLIIQIVDLPGPPASVKLVDSWGFNAALEWTPPKDNGNTEITGYTIQKADKKTGEWFTVLEHFHRLNATVSDLVMGNTYTFRVFAENKVGRSESAAVTKAAAHIQKTGIVYKPLEYKEHDFSEAPKFTAPLSDRAATVGYTTKLLCAVRGSPKPKIEWLKNQMLIGDDPKYRQINNQGVCSLEIRKPSSFDGGVYTCRAKNALGEATVACKLEVKQVIIPDEKGK
ncbi:LOW QUALITY PROTEIN: myosin binding protein Ha [Labeo rohita]|uniref:LOW QUALITY PROTEIN: myosin binding protein Ha n=1 Tax=Labeo rohita TaxID=84645 RepID=UPI0021E2F009|nr:LOW QUALITY PROTEIN: myosin binding protein Ha [Labeo rohita]